MNKPKSNPPRLSDLTQAALQDVTKEAGQPAYRAAQVWQWMSQRGVFDLAEMKNVPAKLRTYLAKRFPAKPLQVTHSSLANDGTEKVLFTLADGKFIESVLIPAERRTTVCLSSQVGCAVGCHFCASGIGGGKR
ncbi:MAG: 23S rRNA (adenine2503-C2)-methyltransferase, partial [Planctomycetota bacterium]